MTSVLFDLLIIIAPFQPPNDIRLIQVQPGRITFNWTSVDAQCDSLAYNIISSNCGSCPPITTNTNVTCTGIVASGQVCTFTVQAVVCGNLTGNQSGTTSVIMKGVHNMTQWRMHCVASSLCNKNILKFMTFHRNAMQMNARIGSESILAFHCVAASVNAKARQHSTGTYVVYVF